MLPRLYAIIDADLCVQRSITPVNHARALISAGCTLIQYRNKSQDKQGSTRTMLADALAIRNIGPPHVKLIMNDRADLCLAACFDGVHLGQDDLSITSSRKLCPTPLIIGLSTHNADQLVAADATSADYLAIGPIFTTSSKSNPDPNVGIEGLRTVRKLTMKPLVAIGGITLENCRAVIDSGADSVAVISALLPETAEADPAGSVQKRVEAFLRVLG
jgi:thiamine-phosphate pyrophosphorylase